MSLRGRKNLPVGSSISSWAGAPAILDDMPWRWMGELPVAFEIEITLRGSVKRGLAPLEQPLPRCTRWKITDSSIDSSE